MPWFSFRAASTKHKSLIDEGGVEKDRRKSMLGEKSDEKDKKKTLFGNSSSRDASPTPAKREDQLQFYTQLAHGGSTKRINSFISLRDLYTKLANELEVDINTMMFCTLNTPKIEMDRLLCGQIVYNDFIFVHVQGDFREVTIKKTEKSLGITITDNGMGCCFVKRVRAGSTVEKSKEISVGDQLVLLENVTLVGLRHYTVAQKLKEVPVGSDIHLVLGSPQQGFDSKISPRKQTVTSEPVADGKATIRLKHDGTVSEAVTNNWLEKAKLKIDDLLESYMGIRDLELACSILELSDDNKTRESFSEQLNGMLGEFLFPDDFVSNLMAVIEEERRAGEEGLQK